jgi:phage terminase small subunit
MARAPVPDHLRKKRKLPATPNNTGPLGPTPKRGARNTEEAKSTRIATVRTALNTSTNEAAEQIDPNKPLTEKQRLFVKNWAAGDTPMNAAIRAGYSEGGATLSYRLIRMPNILRLYEQEKKAYEDSVQMTRKRVMEGLLEGVEMAKLMAEPTAVIAGWREIGKMCGYYEPVKKKVELTVNGQVAMQRMERMSDEELMKLISGAMQDVLGHEAASGEEGDDD